MIDKTNSLDNPDYGQYIVFELENEMYGLSVKKTESIERMTQITRIPDSSEYVLGIINLRGDILPVLSQRLRMGLKPKEYDSNTRIIVIDAGNYRVGIVVDRVVEILNMSETGLQHAKEILTDRESHLFEGIYKFGDNVVMILDTDIILNIEHSSRDKENKDAIVI
jgi:purine-binding chemotaxis protein CheW